MSLADELLADLEDDNDEELEELKKEQDGSDGKLKCINFTINNINSCFFIN